jgi:predicted transcriptional regulator YdeE
MKNVAMKILLLSIFFPSILFAQTRPSEDVSVGSVRKLTLPGFNFLCVDTQATQKTIGDTSKTEIPKLFTAMKSANIEPHGPLVFIFQDLPQDPDATFDMKIGIAVDESAVAPDGYEIDPLPAVECQTVLYGGPFAEIGQAFQKLMPKLYGQKSDLTPTGELREYFLYYENATSPNNVTLIAGVVK